MAKPRRMTPREGHAGAFNARPEHGHTHRDGATAKPELDYGVPRESLHRTPVAVEGTLRDAISGELMTG